jgi:hypothetical protein
MFLTVFLELTQAANCKNFNTIQKSKKKTFKLKPPLLLWHLSWSVIEFSKSPPRGTACTHVYRDECAFAGPVFEDALVRLFIRMSVRVLWVIRKKTP